MELTAAQIEQFDRDGFLIFPNLFERNEVAVLRREVARLSQVQADEVVREHTRSACPPSRRLRRPE